MTSKQEKLAAARRKLKEFQGKNKEADIVKHKNVNKVLSADISKEYSNDVGIFSNDGEVSKICPHNITQPDNLKPQFLDGKKEESFNERETSVSSFNGSSPPILQPDSFKENENSVQDAPRELSESQNIDGHNQIDLKSFTSNTTIDNSSLVMSERNYGNLSQTNQFFVSDTSNKHSLKDVIEPLQKELQNHAQTITILVQQRNEAQTALTEALTSLNKRTAEANELKQQVLHLTSSTKNLSQRLTDAESVIMKLKLEKEDNLQKEDKLKSLSNIIEVQLNEKQEELMELKRKHQETTSECQQLLHSLQEAQSQLSLYQIQLQQYSADGNSGLATQVSKLQNENLILKQKIVELEKILEQESAEKEESSQKFHIYAQQCNSQLSALNSQLKSYKLENENLAQKNKILFESLFELEKSKEETFSVESFKSEIANLHDQLSALSEKNNKLSISLKEKEEECTVLEKKLDEKEAELNKLVGELKELEEENKKLASEAETPKANERLLATMESEKIAAAKAVLQNQKLKEQVFELEKAFMKISEEKLELTNELAHEKHINSELQNALKNAHSHHHTDVENDNYHHHHHHHDHTHECHEENEKLQPLVNDSHEIEELRNIVRQLQDDKVELTTRLNSYESNKGDTYENREKLKNSCKHEHEHEHEHEHSEEECCETKLLLQQMEEKVRKTMNEIAVLDEEKEKLEHLVMQLQGETETIGEYITLYQNQRMLLRQRAQEKDIQLQQLSKDKEELKSKLFALDELVESLLAERKNVRIQPETKSTGSTSSLEVTENTAGKIRALISEIGSTTLIDNQAIVFEHCSCCSGRLITI